MSRQEWIFIFYSHDKFGYRFYDHVEKKLVRSCDIIFVEGRTIEDIGKIEKSESPSTDNVANFDPTPRINMPNVAYFDNQNDDV